MSGPDTEGPQGNAEAPKRKLGLIAAIALIMGNMIGSGVFLLPASLAPFGWNAVFAWIIVTAGTMVLAWVFASLTKMMPEARVPAGFVTAAFGEVPAFLVNWAYWVSVWTAVISIAVAAVSYLSSFVPAIGETALAPALSAIGLVWAMTLINLRGVRAAGNFQIVTLLLKVIPLLAIIVIAAIAFGDGSAEVRPFAMREINGLDLRAAAALTFFALLGFECASMAAARVENPEINVPRATMWGTALTGMIYLLVCSAVGLMLPEAVATTSPAPLATFVEYYWSPGPAALVALFAIISCVGAVNGWILMQGELPRSMAEQRTLPRWFGATDARGTPARALIVSSVIATICLALNSSRSMQGIYEFVLLLSTSAALWLYLAVALAAWRLKVVRPFAAIGAAYALWTLWGAGIEASGWSLVLMLSGYPLYWWAKREKATA
ncbi:amino acid permease [Altererythrobacter arenosus]|uniref:Arginine/agmatine antiporter n=1 Tax=Altererythrobacter arenosus TaxID=3032592 RepID=A0ABY8FTC2_9SPHN|nr:amino acid permease [Altererythrobacter sp. CAU 1644]WFL78264.1 amino acid permease [Altererythrobacter sp. CAU 1644]